MAKKNETATPSVPAVKATKCPITRKQFASAPTIKVQIGESFYVAVPKQFSTGSMGWNVNDKSVIEIDGVPCKVQIGLNVTVVGSKELPQ